jgi:hypothetical protein
LNLRRSSAQSGKNFSDIDIKMAKLKIAEKAAVVGLDAFHDELRGPIEALIDPLEGRLKT